jgi:hypothetical protein
MELFGAVGGGLFVLACLIVGLRVLLLAYRTGELPELCMGLGLVLMGGLSYPINVTARLAVGMSDEVRLALMLLSQLLMLVGCIAIAIFNARVFRPHARWPLALVAGIGLGLVGFFLLQCWTDGFLAFVLEGRGIYRFSIIVHGIPYLWAFIESTLYFMQLRKRRALGLADPLVTNRIRLWSITTGAATILNQLMILLEILRIDSATSPVAGAIVGPVGMVAAVCLWLAFDAPAAYTRRVLVRS